ncbi:MAG: phosphatase PAP2 family protein [Gemmatimonadales bacterium]
MNGIDTPDSEHSLGDQRALVAALSLGAIYAVLTAAVTSGLTRGVDTWVILGIGAGQSPAMIPVMQAASWVAAGAAIPLALLITLALLQRGARRLAGLYAATCLSGWALNILLKEMTRRVRPDGISAKLTAAGFYSFPSGHAMLALLVFGFGSLLLARTIRRRDIRLATIGVGAIITLLVGLSRVYLGRALAERRAGRLRGRSVLGGGVRPRGPALGRRGRMNCRPSRGAQAAFCRLLHKQLSCLPVAMPGAVAERLKATVC